MGLVLLPKGMACPHCASVGDGQPLRLLDSMVRAYSTWLSWLTTSYPPPAAPDANTCNAPTPAPPTPSPEPNQEEARSYQDSPSTLAGLARSSSGLRSDMGSGMMGSSEQRAHSPLKVWWWSWY